MYRPTKQGSANLMKYFPNAGLGCCVLLSEGRRSALISR